MVHALDIYPFMLSRWRKEYREGKSIRLRKLQRPPNSGWVDTESLLPLERELYDRAGRLWKKILFDHVTPINGIPTPLRIRMVDVQQEGSTELLMSGVRYDVELPDELFDPDGLPQVIASPLWESFSTPSTQDN